MPCKKHRESLVCSLKSYILVSRIYCQGRGRETISSPNSHSSLHLTAQIIPSQPSQSVFVENSRNRPWDGRKCPTTSLSWQYLVKTEKGAMQVILRKTVTGKAAQSQSPVYNLRKCGIPMGQIHSVGPILVSVLRVTLEGTGKSHKSNVI